MTYIVFNGKEEAVARGNAPNLEMAKALAEKPKPEPLLRIVTETNGTSRITHVKKPGRPWVESEQKCRPFERVVRPEPRS